MKFEFNGPVVSEEKVFESDDGRTMDGRRTGKTWSDWYTNSSPRSLQLR